MRLQTFPDQERYDQLARDYAVVPVCMEVLADTETPVSLLQRFYQRGRPLFLFESVEGGERWGRYSFMGVSARTKIDIYTDQVSIITNGNHRHIDHGGDPLAILRRILADYAPAPMPQLPRFWGGLVGYFTYEAVSFFEKVPIHTTPDAVLASLIIPHELIIFDNVRHTMTCLALTFPQMDGGDRHALFADGLQRARALSENIECRQPPAAPVSQACPPLTGCYEPSAFQQAVKTVKTHIRQGDVIQTVISQPFACPAPADPVSLYRAQRFINPSPYLFFMDLGDTLLVGSSPETMVRLENGTACLRPIAGTRPRGATEQQDRALADELLADEKERAEHLMLVDLGRNDLGRVAQTGTVQVTDLMIVERYSHVMHLVSNIVSEMDSGLDAFDLLRATFPAGTLTGAPKVRAMEIIAELEPSARGPYGGAVGYISFSGNMDLAITIRTACIRDGQLTVRAGAGIVADSDPEKEHLETVSKAAAIEKAVALINRQATEAS